MLADAETTEDAVLGGRLVLRQPKRGHRFGHDAILLAAAVDAQASEIAVDFGAGVGAAGLALAHRVPRLEVRLIELTRRWRGSRGRTPRGTSLPVACRSPSWILRPPLRSISPRRRCCRPERPITF
jgi:hypothetical protein